MATFTPSRITLNSEILQLLEAISRKQGELSARRESTQEAYALQSAADVDAVHFSTKIEGNTLSRDQVTAALSASKPKGKGRDLQEVLSYSRARKMAREWALKGKPYNDEWVLKHHSEVLKGILEGKLRGHYREAQCVIRDAGTHAIVYMAPDFPEVPKLMKGLLAWLRSRFAANESVPLLAAQFHFEFVTIHPFMDGNGRLARLLTNSILMAGSFDIEKYAALEKQHEKIRGNYYRALRALQAGSFYDIPPGQDIQGWVVYWLKCLLAAYEEAMGRVSGIGSERDEPGFGAFEERLKRAEALFRKHLKLRALDYAELLAVGRTQAVADLNQLVQAGKIEKVGGGRSTVYRLREKK